MVRLYSAKAMSNIYRLFSSCFSCPARAKNFVLCVPWSRCYFCLPDRLGIGNTEREREPCTHAVQRLLLRFIVREKKTRFFEMVFKFLFLSELLNQRPRDCESFKVAPFILFVHRIRIRNPDKIYPNVFEYFGTFRKNLCIYIFFIYLTALYILCSLYSQCFISIFLILSKNKSILNYFPSFS